MCDPGTQAQKRGVLILIEGLDRVGKSTQCDILVKRLKDLQIAEGTGKDVKLRKFPDRTTNIGKLINTYLTDKSTKLSDEAIHLLFSANRWECIDDIKEELLAGNHVVMDRYVYSGVAYSAAKGLSKEWCLASDKGLIKPDLTFFLHASSSLDLISRGGYGEERYEDASFQDKVKDMFGYFIAEAQKEINSESKSKWVTLNVEGKSIEQVSTQIWEIYLQTVSTTEFSSFSVF